MDLGDLGERSFDQPPSVDGPSTKRPERGQAQEGWITPRSLSSEQVGTVCRSTQSTKAPKLSQDRRLSTLGSPDNAPNLLVRSQRSICRREGGARGPFGRGRQPALCRTAAAVAQLDQFASSRHLQTCRSHSSRSIWTACFRSAMLLWAADQLSKLKGLGTGWSGLVNGPVMTGCFQNATSTRPCAHPDSPRPSTPSHQDRVHGCPLLFIT